eukprot:6440930-Pyramimonas_sp.AAC.1
MDLVLALSDQEAAAISDRRLLPLDGHGAEGAAADAPDAELRLEEIAQYREKTGRWKRDARQ